MLLAAGAAVDAADAEGGTALIWAARKGDISTVLVLFAAVRALLAAGGAAAADAKGVTALCQAAREGRAATVLALVARGASSTQLTQKGRRRRRRLHA